MKGNYVFLSLISPLLQGFGLGAGLILAIGAQNAFVLRQGLKRRHIFVVASLCTLSDVVLIFLGQAGLGTLIAANSRIAQVVTWCGIAFLLVYGFRSFKAAFTSETLEAETSAVPSVRLRDTVTTVLAVSLLNPHAFLDTAVLLGSVGAHYHLVSRLAFALGAILASLLWFFSLAYGAAWLAPLFHQPRIWRVLDISVGCVMWSIAFSLLWKAIP
jgi:L-lysine exporter family protein LysE/ArgO